MIKNRKAIIALTALLAAANIMPVTANVIYQGESTTTASSTSSQQGKVFEGNGWLWVDGKCYYFTSDIAALDPGMNQTFKTAKLFKGANTSPDGYTIDETGAWTVDGVVQTNDFGREQLGMASQYAGKSDDEIWNLMSAKLKEIWSDMYASPDWLPFRENSKNFLQGNVSPNGGSWKAMHNYMTDVVTQNRGYIKVQIPVYWSNAISYTVSAQGIAFAANAPVITERTLKTALGDNAGQEVFNVLRNAAETRTTTVYKPLFNEDGSPVMEYILHKEDGTAWECTDETGSTIIRARTELNSGINSEAWVETRGKNEVITSSAGNYIDQIDWSGFQNRETDYGKHYSVSSDGWITIY